MSRWGITGICDMNKDEVSEIVFINKKDINNDCEWSCPDWHCCDSECDCCDSECDYCDIPVCE